MTDNEITPERRTALLGAALHAVAWQLVEYETDTSDRGVSEEHYRDALERAKAILPTLMPGVVAEEPESRRWFTPAYRAMSGNIIAFGDETVVQEHAQRYVDQFAAEDPEGPDYFVATRILSPWVRVEATGG